MLQEVLNYEHDIMLKETTASRESSNRLQNDRNAHRYGLWRLHEIIQRNTQRWIDYRIKWIGDESYSHALALFYCVLQGCLVDDPENTGREMFLRFKYSLYQESKQVLNIMEQKIFIEHLGLIEDSKNIAEFLKKSTHLEAILIKLFSSRCSQMARKHLKTNSSIKHSKMQELQWYSALFPFCTFVVLEEKCSSLAINKANFLIVQEKDCFFIIDEQTNHKFESCRISQISTRKKIRTQVYGHGLEYFDSLKSFDMLDSKHEGNFVDDLTKKGYMIKSESKQSLTGPNSDQKPSKISLSNQIQSHIHQIHENENKRAFFIKEHKKSQGQTEKQKKMQNLRGSISDKKILVSFGSPKITSQRASLSKQKNKSMSKKQSYKLIYSIPSQIPEIVERKQEVPTQLNRQNFIYHSLNPQNFPQLKKDDLPQKYSSRIPKFLTKRTQETIPYTFSNSPVKDLRQTPTKHTMKKQNKQKEKEKEKRQPKMSLTHQTVPMPSFAFSSLEDIKDAMNFNTKPAYQ